MATLDYAIHAEYARVDAAGLLSVLGASFDRVQAAGPGSVQPISVALRVLLEEGETEADFDVKLQPPSGQFALGFAGTAVPNEQTVVVDQHRAVVLTVSMVAPLGEAGRYQIVVSLNEQPVKTLSFLVDQAPGPGE